MAPDAAAAAGGKKRKRYLPHNKPVKKGSYPLHPGVQGFFITCDGGREHQASREALNILDSFYEELIDGDHPSAKELSNRPLYKKITFADSDSSSSDDDDEEEEEEEKEQVPEGVEEKEDKKPKLDVCNTDNTSHDNETGEKTDNHKIDDLHAQAGDKANDDKGDVDSPKTTKETADELPAVKQCCKTNVPTSDLGEKKVEEKSIDKLIEDELVELRDKSKTIYLILQFLVHWGITLGHWADKRFAKLESGCNGVVFVQMRKKDGDKSPKDIVTRIVTSAASTRKHMSRFILRILPIEVSCYASKEEISKAIIPLVEQNFPVETQNPQKVNTLHQFSSTCI
ncbi:THUMP domain-containing protein 1-like [Trifolium pratense]|uniref:THUMP domain-containing protein 1-like n=1 Tax=Trifolium pratense TaxID=57577 RepID=A0A2K3N3Z9_TRIPR|nr:THUMP domain-containing protein 1-like [Trifolium pratense]